MKQQKISADWYSGLVHFLVAGFAFPFAAVIIFGIPLTIYFEKNIVIITILVQIIASIFIWIGIIYSAKYIAKMYGISNSERVVNFSAIYYVLFEIISRASIILNRSFTLLEMAGILFMILNIVIFYCISKQKIKNTTEELA